jgi:hypothetical protein
LAWIGKPNKDAAKNAGCAKTEQGKMLKKRGKYFWLAGGALAFAAVILAVLIVPAESNSGITCKGKPLEYWFSQTPITMVNTNGFSSQIVCINMGGQTYGCYLEKPGDVKTAFGAMGTNCLPFLVKKLSGQETQASMFFLHWQRMLALKKQTPVDKDIERGQAVTALKYLDPLPRETYEQIRALSKSPNSGAAASAKEVLSECHEMPPGNKPLKIHQPAKLQ